MNIKSFLTKKLVLAALSVLVIFMLFISLISAIMSAVSSNNTDCNYANVPLSEDVLKWEPMVTYYAREFEVEEYVPLILAIIMQESGGKSVDVMQSSESGYNTDYPKVPSGITDPDYSIWCGVQVIRDTLKGADVKSPEDIENISLALQGYNFGNGFVNYAKERGGYSLEVAKEFSAMMTERLGWSCSAWQTDPYCYGDINYVSHVLRYYSNADISCNPTEDGLTDVVEIALLQLGKPYVWGASGPDSFDCSGLVYYAYKTAGYNVDRLTAEGYMNISTITLNPQPGDLVFFSDETGYIYHTGIYLGDNKMVHAPNSSKPVEVTSLDNSYYKGRIAGYGKLGGNKNNE